MKARIGRLPTSPPLKAEGLGATVIAKRLGVGRASVYRVLASWRAYRGIDASSSRKQHIRC